MKLRKVYFPFVLGGILLLSVFKTSFSQTSVSEIAQTTKDSLLQYYSYSLSDSLSLKNRLYYNTIYLHKGYSLKNDSLIFKGLLMKTWLLGLDIKYDSAIFYTNRLYDLAVKNRDTIIMQKALIKLGLYHGYTNKITEAFEFYNEAYKISRANSDSTLAAISLMRMSSIQRAVGDYSGSKITATDGLKYLKNSNDLKTLGELYHAISISNREQKNLDEALRYNSKAISTTKRFKYVGYGSNLKVSFQNTRANILADKKKYGEAILILERLVADSLLSKSKMQKARLMDNLGYIKWLENPDSPDALLLMKKALKIRKEIKDGHGSLASYIHLTKFYFNIDKSKALSYAEEAYENTKDRGNLAGQIDALEFIFELKENTKKEAKEYVEIQNSLKAVNQSNREIYAVTKYENEELSTENLVLKAEKAKKERQLIIYLSLAALLLATGLFFIYFLQQRFKREKIRDIYHVETNISKKLHDEIAGDMYHIMIQMENKNSDSEMIDKLEELYLRTRDFSRENSGFDVGPEYGTELCGMIKSYEKATTKIIVRGPENVNWNSINPEKKIIIFRVLQELMINMKKHSCAEFVAITFEKISNQIKINYSDNGVGVSIGSLVMSNGLRNAENRIKAIGGLIIFESHVGKGFKAQISFPA